MGWPATSWSNPKSWQTDRFGFMTPRPTIREFSRQAQRVEVKTDAESTGVDIQLVNVPFVRVSGKGIDFTRGAVQAYATIGSRSMGGGAGEPIKPELATECNHHATAPGATDTRHPCFRAVSHHGTSSAVDR
jgi:hypothetical protein